MSNIIEFPGLGFQVTVNSHAFTIFGIDIQWYGILIAIGFVLALIYALKRSKSFGIDGDRLVDCVIGGIIGGIIGARLYYVAFNFDVFKNNLLSVFDIRQGGLAIYGGLIGALAVGLLVAKWRKVKYLPLLDIAGIGFLLGQAIGRWGNFFNVEAFGSNTTLPWGMTGTAISDYLLDHLSSLQAVGISVNPNLPVHPTFLYESLWCIIGFVLLHFLSKKRRFDGEIFLMYIAWYSFERFFVEGLRTDSLMIGRLRVSQVLSAILFIASVVMLIVIRYKIYRNGDPEYLKLYAHTDECKAMFAAKEAAKQNKQVDSVAQNGHEDLTEDGEDAFSAASEGEALDFSSVLGTAAETDEEAIEAGLQQEGEKKALEQKESSDDDNNREADDVQSEAVDTDQTVDGSEPPSSEDATSDDDETEEK